MGLYTRTRLDGMCMKWTTWNMTMSKSFQLSYGRSWLFSSYLTMKHRVSKWADGFVKLISTFFLRLYLTHQLNRALRTNWILFYKFFLCLFSSMPSEQFYSPIQKKKKNVFEASQTNLPIVAISLTICLFLLIQVVETLKEPITTHMSMWCLGALLRQHASNNIISTNKLVLLYTYSGVLARLWVRLYASVYKFIKSCLSVCRVCDPSSWYFSFVCASVCVCLCEYITNKTHTHTLAQAAMMMSVFFYLLLSANSGEFVHTASANNTDVFDRKPHAKMNMRASLRLC